MNKFFIVLIYLQLACIILALARPTDNSNSNLIQTNDDSFQLLPKIEDTDTDRPKSEREKVILSRYRRQFIANFLMMCGRLKGCGNQARNPQFNY